MNSRSVAIFAAVVAVLVGVSVWYLYSPFASHYTDNPEATPVPTPTTPVVTPPEASGTANTPPKPQPKAQPKAAPVPVPVEPLTEDDRRIESALTAFPGDTDADHDRTAGLLIGILPTLGKDAQVECVQHITNLLSDAEYPKLLPIWKNAQFNPDVIELIGADLNNRSDKIKMNAWLDALKNPTHPYHDDAKSNLEIFLEEDYEKNIPKWEQGVKRYLEKQAKEEAEAEAGQ